MYLIWVIILDSPSPARSSTFLWEFAKTLSPLSLLKKALKWPVECMNFSNWSTAMGLLRRKDSKPTFQCNLNCSSCFSHLWCGQSSKKCLTVLMVMPWQSGHNGISDLRIQKRWWLRVMWPDQSWKRSDAWQQSSSDMRQRYFLEGVELSIDLSMFSLFQLFHLHLHLFLSLSECDCWRAEMLSGRHLWRSVGRNLASSSVHSFGSRSQ